MSTVVYILPSQHQSNAKALRKLFLSQKDIFILAETTSSYATSEAEMVLKTLKLAVTTYPNKNILLLQNTSTTLLAGETISQLISSAIDVNHRGGFPTSKSGLSFAQWDLLFLNSYFDRCDLYKEIATMDFFPSLVQTFSPLSLQALMFTPLGAKKILAQEPLSDGSYFTASKLSLADDINKQITNGNLIALATVPNIFSYDILLMQNNTDLQKMQACRAPSIAPKNNNTDSLPFVFFLAVVIIIILAWLYCISTTNMLDDSQ